MKKRYTIELVFVLLSCGVYSQNDTLRLNPSLCIKNDTIGFNISGDKARVIAQRDKKLFYMSGESSLIQYNNRCVWYIVGSKELKTTTKFYIWYIDPSTGKILKRKKRKAPKRTGKF